MINEDQLITDLEPILKEHGTFETLMLGSDFKNFSIYEAKVGFVAKRLSVSKRMDLLKALVDYAAQNGSGKLRVEGTMPKPDDFDMEIYVLSLEVNVHEG